MKNGEPAKVLDGLHFPHILDGVIEHSGPATLLAISQVCHEWRKCIKGLFYHSTVYAWEDIEHLYCTSTPQLLHHCQILDSEPPEGNRCVNETGIMYDAFPSLTTVRLSNCWEWKGDPVGVRILHYGSADASQGGCPACYWPARHAIKDKPPTNVERFVLTTWGEEDQFDRRIPDSFGCIVAIFLMSADPGACSEYLEELWNSFGELAADAWIDMKPFIVVNAGSLAAHPTWLRVLEGDSVEEGMRLKAIEIIVKDYNFMRFSDMTESNGASGTSDNDDEDSSDSASFRTAESGSHNLESDSEDDTATDHANPDASMEASNSDMPGLFPSFPRPMGVGRPTTLWTS